jgi:hypothetical protein
MKNGMNIYHEDVMTAEMLSNDKKKKKKRVSDISGQENKDPKGLVERVM